MAYSVRIVLRKYKPNSMGYHILQLCVTKNSSRKRISLKLYVDPAYWDNSAERLTIERNLKGEKQREANKKRIQDNAFLDKVKARAREIIEKFEIDGIDWTLNQFEETFLNPSKQGKFCAYLENHIQTLRDTGHTGNAKCYFETLRLLKYYDGKLSQRLFSDIDLRYVRNFDTFLQKRGCKGNTRKYYFKALRAILNQAKREGVGSEAAYPFVKGGFEIAKLEEATEKRYLPPQDLQKLKDTPAQNLQNEYARQLFLFSYYCYGMSFVDMAYLTTDHIQRLADGNYIVYKRNKIKHQKNATAIRIHITPEIQGLIERLKSASPTVENYLLPIITCSGYTGEKLYNHIRSRYAKYQKYLKSLAEELGIDYHLTSYVSRHTMAMTLQYNKIPREIISQMLGHADLETTNTYLDSFDNKVINEAAKVL